MMDWIFIILEGIYLQGMSFFVWRVLGSYLFGRCLFSGGGTLPAPALPRIKYPQFGSEVARSSI